MVLTTALNEISLGYGDIDQQHGEFIVLIQQLDTAEKTLFPELFQKLVEHTTQHFEYENALMETYRFPAQVEHQGEHHRVLAELNDFKKRVDRGLLTFGYAYVRERLPQWFTLHVNTMDSALVAHVNAMTSSS